MKKSHKEKKSAVKQSRFPRSIFFIVFIILLITSGVHVGIIVLMSKMGCSDFIQTNIPMIYWVAVASVLTILIKRTVRAGIEEPIIQLADASAKVARGDFSVFVPTLNTGDKLDYLDIMIVDFNKMVEELGSIETLKTDFFSNVSHEIKTPLSVISNCAEMLQNENCTDAQRKECSESILQASKRLSNLITNMLKLNKLEKQTINPMPEPYDVCRQLIDCALQFEDTWEKRQIEFVAEIEDSVIIEADSGLMELVWNNLLSNAIKFTPDGGIVTLDQKSTEGEIIVSVTDTGCGMDEITLKHIFDKFYQGDTSHSTEGNGLGLALVQRILQLSDGDIQVTSKVGQGSSFIVTIPKTQISEKRT